MVESMPSSLFTEWLAFLDCELNEHSKQDYYLAQLSAQVSTGLQGGRAKTKDYLIKFSRNDDRLVQSKKAWQSVTGKKAQ